MRSWLIYICVCVCVCVYRLIKNKKTKQNKTKQNKTLWLKLSGQTLLSIKQTIVHITIIKFKPKNKIISLSATTLTK